MPAKNFAFCGLNCGMCPAYLATAAGSMEQREKVAAEWSVQFGAEIKPEDINCLGCKSEGPFFNFCEKCEIRICAKRKALPNCGHCQDYACSKLDHIFQAMPIAKDILDAINEAKKQA